MKKILKYTAFAAMVGLFSSCSDSFFEAESGDIITSDQMDEVDPVAVLVKMNMRDGFRGGRFERYVCLFV